MSEGKILVIDDSEPILARVQSSLSAAGYEVVTTTRTVGNAKHLRSADLVVIDFHMPGIDGGEVLATLRNTAPDAKCAYYLYTSDAAVADRYAELGFDGCFTAKGDVMHLVTQVRAAFRYLKLRALSTSKIKR